MPIRMRGLFDGRTGSPPGSVISGPTGDPHQWGRFAKAVTAMLRGRPPQNATLFRKTDHNRLIRGLICIAVR